MAVVDIEFREYGHTLNKSPHLVGAKKTNTGMLTSLEITPLRLGVHAMCCGYLNLRDLSTGAMRWHAKHLFDVLASVETDSAKDRLVPRPEYLGADPSVKTGMSYMLGMAMTRAVATEFFRVPWVCHTSRMKDRHGYELIASKATEMKPGYNPHKPGKEADLIGFDYSGRPHLFEAKGTSYDRTTLANEQKAVNQASMSRGIRDFKGTEAIFVTRNACCFAFGGGLKGVVIDPPQRGTERSSTYLPGLYGSLFDHYALLYKALQTSPTRRYSSDRIDFEGLTIEACDGGRYVLGLDVRLARILDELSFEDYRSLLGAYPSAGSAVAGGMSRAEKLSYWNEEMTQRAVSVAGFVREQSGQYGDEDSANSITSELKAKETVVGCDGIVLVELQKGSVARCDKGWDC